MIIIRNNTMDEGLKVGNRRINLITRSNGKRGNLPQVSG